MVEKMKLEHIHVSKSFKRTKPNLNKVEKYKKYYLENGIQAKPIVLGKGNKLVDGYIQYLILKEFGEVEAEVVHLDKEEKKVELKPCYLNKATTYIYGIHPKSRSKKERVWRVPGNWDNWADNLCVGDLIMCDTKFGEMQVKVTRIEILDERPVDMVIKKVTRKRFLRNGEFINTEIKNGKI